MWAAFSFCFSSQPSACDIAPQFFHRPRLVNGNGVFTDVQEFSNLSERQAALVIKRQNFPVPLCQRRKAGVERRRVVDVDADTTEEAIQIARDMRPDATLLNVKARRLEPDEDLLSNFWKKYEG